ncbi:tripartite motif-containing protein 2-like [Branchiostoma floridae x Branchiostoma japonicum]
MASDFDDQFLTCPVSLPDQGVDGLRTNFYVNNLLDFAAAKKGAEPDHEVTPEETLKAEEAISKFHRKRHCDKHKNQELVFYCESCNALVCTACTVVDHRPGKDHNPAEIPSVAQKKKETLRGLLQGIYPRLNEIQASIKEIDRKISNLAPSKEVVTDQVKAYFGQLIDLLQKREKEILSQIDDQCRADGKALQTKKEAIEFELAGLTSAQTFCQQAVEHGSDVHILEVGNQVQTRVETLLAKQLDLESDWSEFQFVENTTVVDFKKKIQGLGGVKTNVDVSKCKVVIKPAVEGFECIAELTTMNKEGRPCVTSNKAVTTNMKAPSGKNVPPHRQPQLKSGGVWEISYLPKVTGIYRLEVKVNSQQVPGSPFDVEVKGNPVLTIGQEGRGVGELDLPLGVVVEKDDAIAVVEQENKRVQIFNAETGQSLRSFPVDGGNLLGIDVDSSGAFLVTSWDEDFGLRRYSKEGRLLDTYKPDCMLAPLGLTVLKDGRMVMADFHQKLCLLLQPDGSLIREIGKGKLHGPVFVSADEKRDVLFVTDASAHKVFAFDLDGNFIFDFGRQGDSDGEFQSPCGVTTDSAGNVVVVNHGDGRVQVFGPDGKFIRTAATVKGSGTGIVLTSDGYIAVTCFTGHCIELCRYK